MGEEVLREDLKSRTLRDRVGTDGTQERQTPTQKKGVTGPSESTRADPTVVTQGS